MGISILIGSKNENVTKKLAYCLIDSGFEVRGEVTDSYELLRKIHTLNCDICVIDFNMIGMNGHQLAEVLVLDRILPVIVMVSPADIQHFTNLKNEVYFEYIMKPINKNILVNTIKMMTKSCAYVSKLERELKSLKKQLKNEDIVNKAKLLLMDKLKISENEAYKKIQVLSMNKGISKINIAKDILSRYK